MLPLIRGRDAAAALFALTLVGYPAVAPLPVVLGLPSRLISVPFRAFVLLLALWLLVRRSQTRSEFTYSAFWIAWISFWGMYLMRVVLDGVLQPDNLRLPLSEYLLFAIGVSFLPAIAVGASGGPFETRRAATILLVLGTVGALANLIVVMTNVSAGISLVLGTRAETETLNPISLAHLGVSVFIVSAWLLLESPRFLTSISLGAAALVGLSAVLLSASRGPLLVLPIAIPVLFLRALTHRRPGSFLRLGVLLSLIAAAAAWLLRSVDSLYLVTRLQTSVSGELRVQLLKEGWDLFLRHPVLGAGTEPLASYPHNLILESFMVYGIATGLLFVLLVAISMYAAARLILGPAGWMSLLYLQALLGGMVSGSLYASAPLWMLMAAVIVADSNRALSANPDRARWLQMPNPVPSTTA